MGKSYIQIFIENVTQTILTILKVILLSHYFPKKSWLKNDAKECLILGNGPSLNELINNSSQFIKGKILICVNYFARTDFYKLLKPNYYIITSPEYFGTEEKLDWDQDRMLTFQAISENTDWEMTLLVPYLARKRKSLVKMLNSNPNIKIHYFNNTPIDGFTSINHWFYNLDLGMPRPHNVLIPAIFLSIKLKFGKVYLAGADHSWLKNIYVDEDNQVLLSQKHFYDTDQSKTHDKNTNKSQPMYIGGSKRKRKLHEVLTKYVYSFRSYWELNRYAQSRGTRILNITSNSFIDAFERVKID